MLLLLPLVIGALVPSASARPRWTGTARYSVPTTVLDKALDCKDGEGKSEPVLLVHGTYVNRRVNFEWNYWRSLPKAGFDVCWVDIPNGEMNDAQISAEYVARAVEVMALRYSEKIDILGHSQGALLPRWAIKFFPSARFIDDYVGLASPSHGTQLADTVRDATGACHESCWQMARGSTFLEVLNATDETPGPISYTSIYTQFDEVVIPSETSAIEGATNILLQDICPARPIDHLGIVGDGLTFSLVIDALTHPAPQTRADCPLPHAPAV